MDFSIIIRLINRGDLKNILSNVKNELTGYSKGEYELVVLDLFEEEENITEAYGDVVLIHEEDKEKIVMQNSITIQDCLQICQSYGAKYLNKTTIFSDLRYDYVLFIDSDVQFSCEIKLNGKSLFGKHACFYEKLEDDKICGVLGVTNLIENQSTKITKSGKTKYQRNFKSQLNWRILEYSRIYRDCYSQHTYLKYANFSPPNNVSYNKSAIEKAGLLEKNIPKTFHDHLDLSYTLIENGYKIKCVSDIIVTKQKEEFNKANKLKTFLKLCAKSDYDFGKKHSHTLVKSLPSLILLSLIILVVSGVTSAATFTFFPIILGVTFCFLSLLSAYIIDTKKSKNKNFFYYILGKFLDLRVYLYKESYRRKNKDKKKEKIIIYNAHHAKAKFMLQAKKLKIAVFNLVFLTIIILILLRTIGVF
ncbi:MAG: hypothetical protein FWE03_01220 [Firmicutes bacterium]|nr:hypothetical protein [Bacillota bacterium]